MAGSESHDSPLERVTGEKDVHPEEERERGRSEDRREPGAGQGGKEGGARRGGPGGGERDTGS